MKSEYQFTPPAKSCMSPDKGVTQVMEKGEAQVPNKPGILDNYFHGYQRFQQDSRLTFLEQELIFQTISEFQGYDDGTAAHAGTEERFLMASSADRLGANPRLEELRKFTQQLLLSRGQLSKLDVQTLLASGYQESHILSIIHAVSIRILSHDPNQFFPMQCESDLGKFSRISDNIDSKSESGQAPILGHSMYGNGRECVLVLHDWMGDSGDYEGLIPYLNLETYSYVFADLRGYGKSRLLVGDFTLDEIKADLWRLLEHLGWHQYHVIGHSMTGMVVQAMALDDASSDARRIKSIVAITPVSANGYPADEATKEYFSNLIHNRSEIELSFALFTGQRLSTNWQKLKADRHLQTSKEVALKNYLKMWLETDFSGAVKKAGIGLPILVIGGKKDFSGFQGDFLKSSFGALYEKVVFSFIEDAGHYPMQETPVLLVSLIEEFFERNC